MAADRRAVTEHRPVDDRFAIDSMGDCLAYPYIVERLALVIGGKNRLAFGGADDYRKAGIGLNCCISSGAGKLANASTSPASMEAAAAAGSEINLKVAVDSATDSPQ